MDKIITVPFGWLLSVLYQFTSNYGVSLILFAVLVKLILLPISAKSKKSSMKMSRLTPRMQDIQTRYASDQQKQSEALQELYREEGVSMGGGCLWSILPILIIFPLYTVIRQPIVYMLGETLEVATRIVEVIKTADPTVFTNSDFYDQLIAAQQIPNFVDAIKEALPNISEATLAGVNFDFLGINMGAVPSFNIFAWEAFDWAHIGLFLVPLLSAGSQVLSMFIMTKLNDSVVTNQDGIHDKEAAKNSAAAQSNKMMMWTMPLMSLWIGFSMPAAMSLYWLIQGLVSIVQDVILTKHYRKIYDAEDAVRIQKLMEKEKEEAEKERIRAERRAANPDGITQNTSKKKLQQKQRAEEEAAKAAAAKEYAAKRGIVIDEPEQKLPLSGIPSRPYCKGRAYDPNRYSTTTEE